MLLHMLVPDPEDADFVSIHPCAVAESVRMVRILASSYWTGQKVASLTSQSCMCFPSFEHSLLEICIYSIPTKPDQWLHKEGVTTLLFLPMVRS